MKVHVRFFARARDLAGTDSVWFELPAAATVAELRCRLKTEYPALGVLIDRSAFAVDDEFAEDGLSLANEAEVALLPPVSGG